MNDLIIENLSLRTKECYINAIISGEQKVETRIAYEYYAKKLLHYIDNSRKKWDDVKQVKRLHLYAGNRPGCKFVDVEVNNTYLTEFIKNIPEGFKKGDMIFEFELGKVIDHN